MKTSLFFVLFVALAATMVSGGVRRRRQSFEEIFGGGAEIPTQPTTPQTQLPTTTTLSPNSPIARCITACVVLPHYNPVCGSNRVTYNNMQQLNCAKRCGVEVDLLFGGVCRGL